MIIQAYIGQQHKNFGNQDRQIGNLSSLLELKIYFNERNIKYIYEMSDYNTTTNCVNLCF